MVKRLNALIIEDSSDDAELLARAIKKNGFDLSYERVESSETLQRALTGRQWDLIISDFILPHFSGIDALLMVKQMDPDTPFIIVSGKVDEEVLINVFRSGASDFVLKEDLNRLPASIEHALEEAEGRRARKRAEEELRKKVKDAQDREALIKELEQQIKELKGKKKDK